MSCDCCDMAIKDERDKYSYQIQNNWIIVCERCYYILTHETPIETEMSMQELIDALPGHS